MKPAQYVHAKPLLLSALDSQIRGLGGRGFNASVQCQSVQDSFSKLYTFDSAEGTKTLITRNECQIGYIDGRHVMYWADQNEFVLVTVKRTPNPPYKLCLIHHLAHNFDDAVMALKAMWPDRTQWDLRNPADDAPGAVMLAGTTRSDIFEVQVSAVLGEECDNRDTVEWQWIEQNASFAHCQNSDTPGVWEFMVTVTSELADIPERLQPIVQQAQEENACYMIFY
jgi:hypothetical protein